MSAFIRISFKKQITGKMVHRQFNYRLHFVEKYKLDSKLKLNV